MYWCNKKKKQKPSQNFYKKIDHVKTLKRNRQPVIVPAWSGDLFIKIILLHASLVMHILILMQSNTLMHICFSF